MELQRNSREELLRLLWPQRKQVVRGDEGDMTRPVAIAVARKNVVLLRAAARIREHSELLSSAYLDAESKERRRVSNLFEMIARVGDICEKAGVRFMFPKAFQHLPDMGHDVDLMLIEPSKAIVESVVEELKAEPGPDSFVQRFAGKRSFVVPGFVGVLEVHQGRMGHLGEYQRLPEKMWARRGYRTEAGARSPVPSDEDALLIQVIQRIFGHRHLRIADLLRAEQLIRRPIDWPYIIDAARNNGITEALFDYLGTVEQLHHRITGESLVWPAASGMMEQTRRVGLSEEGWLPSAVVFRAYWRKFLSDVVRLDWDSVGRLCFLPMAAVAAKCHRGSSG